MPRYLLPLLAAAALHAGMTDFHTLSEAKAAYDAGDYAEASALYGGLQTKNDAARYDYGNALYKQKKYKEAADAFAGISAPDLKQKALHNLGNSLALSGKTDEAVKAYEQALALGNDEDTRYNLELLKQQKKEQQNKQQKNDRDQKQKDDKKQNDQDKQQQNGKDQNQSNDQKQKSDNGQNKNGKQQNQNDDGQKEGRQAQQKSRPDEKQQQSGEQKKAQPDKAETEKAKGQQAEKAERENDEKHDGEEAKAAMAEPISDMEERKYNQMLDKRGIKTLMIPLSGKGEPHDDETTPW